MNALKHLQGAPSQKAVDDIFLLAFNHREKPISQGERKGVSELLNITAQESQDVCRTRQNGCEEEGRVGNSKMRFCGVPSQEGHTNAREGVYRCYQQCIN